MKIEVNTFGGITPGIAAHLLPSNGATVCRNALRENGNLVPIKAPLQSAVLADIGALVKTIFRHGTQWLAWGVDVDLVRAPIAGDSLGRIIYTGDDKPKFTDSALALSAPPYPAASIDLSLPNPIRAPQIDVNRTSTATIWTDSTIFSAGDVVFPGDDFAYQAGSDGTSGTDSPNWSGVLGATVPDNGITWTCVMVVSTGARQWLAETTVLPGHLVEVEDYLLRALAATEGTTGSDVDLVFPVEEDASVVDGEILWTNNGLQASGPARLIETVYEFGDAVVVGGFEYLASAAPGLTAGTTGTTAPTSASTPTAEGMWLGKTITDGTVAWYVERVVSSGARDFNAFRNRYVKVGDIYEAYVPNINSWHVFRITASGVTSSWYSFDQSTNLFHLLANLELSDNGVKFITENFGSLQYYENSFIRHTAVSRSWEASTDYALGTHIIVDGYIYVVTYNSTELVGPVVYTSGASRGPWPQGWGQTVVDGEILWTCRTPARWVTSQGREASTFYAVGAMQTIDGFNYIARNSGRTGESTPEWPVTVGLTVQDGEVLWECVLFSGLADQEDVAYVETFVRRYAEIDEESLPSPVSVRRTVQFSLGQSLQLTGLNVPPGDSHGVNFRRLYRLALGGSESDYLFLAELPIATRDYLDSTPTDKLAGDVLPSAEWDGAPDGLSGLVIMPGGILAGFIAGSKEVCFSEPYQYHAWPFRYRKRTEDIVVALGVFGNSVLVTTKGTPYVYTGSHPESMNEDRVEVNEACLSKRGLVDLGAAVAYPSPNGLVVIGRGINKVVTATTHRISDWEALNPNTFVGFSHRGRYFAFYNNGTAGLLSIDLAGNVEFFSQTADAVWDDPLAGEVWLAQGLNILKFNAGAPQSLTWTSKPFISTYPQSLGVGQVRASAYPCTLTLKGDGATLHTQSVTSAAPFRLPAKRALAHELTVTGAVEVENVILASSFADLGRG